MRQDLIDRGGFAPPLPYRQRKRQRTTLSLIASIALAVCTVVAVTVVSIGIAQAEILVATQSGDGNLAVAFLVAGIVVGGIVGAIYRRVSNGRIDSVPCAALRRGTSVTYPLLCSRYDDGAFMIRAGFCAIAASIAVSAQAVAATKTFPSSAGPIQVETVVNGLQHPWGLAFLPDGRMLVTERPGRLRIVTPDGKLSPPVAGLPKVFASGQGGLLDVVVDRNFSQNRTIYFCFAEPSGSGARTSLARARLPDGALPGRRAASSSARTARFRAAIISAAASCRRRTTISSSPWATISRARDDAQNLANHIGKIVRIAPDGSAPKDNPFVDRRGAKPEIWSYGHRNSQGAAINPVSGKLWMHEHGPRGGDEINIPERGEELRLAGDRLRHRLQRREDPRRHAEAGHGAADPAMDAGDRAVGHGLLSPPTCFRSGRTISSSAGWSRRRWCGSSSTAIKSPRKNGCCRT